MLSCPVCGASMRQAFSARVLRRYLVNYFYCERCGLTQTEKPYWLGEAYSDAISAADTGLVQRNVAISRRLATILYFLFDRDASYLDIAGGYGMLTRLMRDYGFDFYWEDEYCRNLMARGFEANRAERPFAALTAFEVLEHLHDPLAWIRDRMRSRDARTLIFTTETYRGTSPPGQDWWYYAFETGQHVSFYQASTLAELARRLGLTFVSAHGLHVFTDLPRSRLRGYGLLSGRAGAVLSLYVKGRMTSRTIPDFERMTRSESPSAGVERASSAVNRTRSSG